MFIYFKDMDHSFPFRKARYAFKIFQKVIIYHLAGASGKQKLKGEKDMFMPVFFSIIFETGYRL
jgi:GT2 family glycosyltransferase